MKTSGQQQEYSLIGKKQFSTATSFVSVLASAAVLMSIPASRSFADGGIKKETDMPTVADSIVGAGKLRVNSNLDLKKTVTVAKLLPASLIPNIPKENLDYDEYERMALTVDLNSANGIDRLIQEINAIKDLAETHEKLISKKSLAGLKEARKALLLAQTLKSSDELMDRVAALEMARELVFAFNSKYIRPMPKVTWAGSIFQRLQTNPHSWAGAAKNVVRNDEGKTDPSASTFWKRPLDISKVDVLPGAHANTSLDTNGLNCEYDSPHTGAGLQVSFEAICKDSKGNLINEGRKLKIKFGSETHTGPFNTRVFAALGFNTVRIEYFPGLNLKYDRRLISESNRSDRMESKVTITGLDRISVRLDGMNNPFDDIKEVELKNGKRLPGGLELASRLLIDSNNLSARILERDYAQLRNDKNYNLEFENQIKTFIMKEGSIKFKEADDVVSVGNWDYDSPAIANRRDVRGGAVLNMFLNNYDTRNANTNVHLKKTKNGVELRHLFSDVGSGLGKGTTFFSTSNAEPDKFRAEWIAIDNEGALQISGYNVLERHRTFKNVTPDDAKWMARMIGKIEPEQIKRALVVSGFSSAEVKVLTLRLLQRRDNLVRALGLTGELGLKVEKINAKFNYDSRLEGLIEVYDHHLKRKITAPDNDKIIVDGDLRKR